MIATIVKYTGLGALVIALFALYFSLTAKPEIRTTETIVEKYIESKNVIPVDMDYRVIRNSTVILRAGGFMGTGTVIKYMGENTYRILTAYHVVSGVTDDNPWVDITFSGGVGCTTVGKVVLESKNWPEDVAVVDVAIPKGAARECKVKPFVLKQKPLNVGDKVFYIGHTQFLFWNFHFGHIGSFKQTLDTTYAYTVVNAPGAPGASGSLVLTTDGYFVGVLSRGIPGTIILVPSDAVCKHVKCS